MEICLVIVRDFLSDYVLTFCSRENLSRFVLKADDLTQQFGKMAVSGNCLTDCATVKRKKKLQVHQ